MTKIINTESESQTESELESDNEESESDLYCLQNSPRRNWMLMLSLLFACWMPKHPAF